MPVPTRLEPPTPLDIYTQNVPDAERLAKFFITHGINFSMTVRIGNITEWHFFIPFNTDLDWIRSKFKKPIYFHLTTTL